MERYRNILKKYEKSHSQALFKKHGLICKQLEYSGEVACLYLAKEHWTNRFDPERESTIGVFFSAWVSPELLKKQEFAYTIHSKQLRKLPGYRLASREFADEFRDLVRTRVASWPNIRMDYGPVTLLEGKDTCELDSFEKNVEKRVSDFVGIHEEIDRLILVAAN